MANMVKQNSRFEFTDLTGMIQMIPNQWGLINQMGLFTNVPTTQTSITLDREDHSLVLLDSISRTQRAPQYGRDETAQQYAFPLAYFKRSDYITPEDLQGRRQLGTADQVTTLDQARATKLARARMQHAITMEFMKMQALKGKVVDANGRVYADLITTFGFGAKKQINFELNVPETNVDAKINELVSFIEDNAFMGGLVNGEDIMVLVDTKFFDLLTNHPRIREAYLFYNNAGVQVNRDSFKNGPASQPVSRNRTFSHKGVTFVEYRAQYTDRRGNVHKLVGIDGKTGGVGHAFPNAGVGDAMYQMYTGPANKLEYVNTAGQEMYAFEYEDDRGEGYEIESHMFILPVCTRPQILVDVLATGS